MSNKKKDPALLFYTADFLTGTFTMSNEEVGKYIRLLCLQHQQGELTEKDMFNICNSNDIHILNKFIKNSNGNYYNERLKIESDRRSLYISSRSVNRQGKKKNHINNICKTYVKHMETETINIDKDNKKEGGMEGENTKILFEIKKEINLAEQTSEAEKLEFNIFFDSWNKFAEESNLISASELSPARKQKVTKRLSEHPLEWWNEVFSLCARTLFLNGDGKEGWRASFDWIVANSDNGVKVLEGKYGEPKKSPITPGQIKKGGDADGSGGDGAKIKGQIDYSKYHTA